MDTLSGADFDTFTAGRAFVMVDDGMIVDHVNRVVRADLFALAAADAAIFAYPDGFLGIEVTGTDHFDRLIFVKDADEIVGTGFLTHAAAGAFFPVDNGHAVDDVDCFKLTGFDAVSQSQTAGSTLFFAVVEHIGGSAGHGAGIDVFIFDSAAFSVTADSGFFLRYILEGGYHDLADLAGDFVASRNTEVCLGAVFDDGVGIGLTAGVAAGAAVGVWQIVLDVIYALVLFHGENLRENRKQNTRHQTERHKKQYGQNIFHGQISPI